VATIPLAADDDSGSDGDDDELDDDEFDDGHGGVVLIHTLVEHDDGSHEVLLRVACSRASSTRCTTSPSSSRR
jgi:hypothetical protein